MRTNLLTFIFLGFTVLLNLSCSNEDMHKKDVVKQKVEKESSQRLKEIKEQGKLIAVTDYNSHGYFLYRGTTMGFQYELLKSLA